MANENQIIRSVLDPSIQLDEMSMVDNEEGTDDSEGNITSARKMSKQAGAVAPFIRINGYTFPVEDILESKLSVTGSRPSFSFTARVSDTSFYSINYPKDGDLINVMIRSKDDSLKPIRNDFEILGLNNISRGAEGSYNDRITLSGLLRIPKFTDELCFSKKGSSIKTLIDTCNDLGLGFSTNEISTNDEMTWVNPFGSYEDYLYEITSASWKDSNSFFSYFIDQYYHFNFVNMEPMFSQKAEIEEGLLISSFVNDFSSDSYLAKAKRELVLTNLEDASTTNMYVKNASLNNYSSHINMNEGYKRFVRYYDNLLKEYQNLFVDPLKTNDSEKDSYVFKGRKGEDFYKTQNRTKWMGVLYGTGDNCHNNYLYARVHNHHNNVHLNKMELELTLQSPNSSIRRGQVIPYIHTIQMSAGRKEATTPKGMRIDDIRYTVDPFYSGFFYVNGMEYIYRNGTFEQSLSLIRREWPIPVKNT